MRHFLLPFIALLFPFFAITQTATKSVPGRVLVPKINTVFYKLGKDLVPVRTYQYGESKDFFFINLHDDEGTAVSGAMKILERTGGTLVKLVNYKQRNIEFRMDGMKFTFDPNRIFSRDGIKRTLGNYGYITPRAITEVEKFAARLLTFLPPPTTCIIALHNNSDGKFSITSYQNSGDRKRDAKEVSTGQSQDADDLLLTTDSTLFRMLTKEKFNVVLQDNKNAHKDGSLSIYCGETNRRYLNCETEHGKLAQYTEMLTAVTQHLKTITQPVITTGDQKGEEQKVIVYNYRLAPNPDSVRLAEAYDIYFGEKKIGSIRMDNAIASSWGQMEITKTLPLYDNMEFFYFPFRNDSRKIELRIDPTRVRKLYDPVKAVVPVKIVRY
ncbi:MAG: hypothetical protein ABIR18_11480 [Chitinophagaceae bacterium]